MTRTKYGFERTVSATAKDVQYCKESPGALAPGDETILYEATKRGAESLLEWAEWSLDTSSGFWQGKRVWFLRPARQSREGPCQWLDANDRCKVHALAPYGCAFFGAGDPPAYSQAEEIARSNAHMADIVAVMEQYYAGKSCNYIDVYRHLTGILIGAVKPLTDAFKDSK